MFVVVVLLPTICVGHKLNMEGLLMCIMRFDSRCFRN